MCDHDERLAAGVFLLSLALFPAHLTSIPIPRPGFPLARLLAPRGTLEYDKLSIAVLYLLILLKENNP